MSTSTETKTVYGVARGQKILSGGFTTVEGAHAENGYYVESMTKLGLDPDTYVATYDVSTTVETGRPSKYVAPEPETDGEPESTETIEQPSDPTTTA